MGWTEQDLPDLAGRIAIVTGANSGIGLETARALAGSGAEVVLACRSQTRAEAALLDIRATHPKARVRFEALDLADLASVSAFGARFVAHSERLDLLINNAGVMVPPRSFTAQGYEMQFGVNHLAHFALTGLLLDRLLATAGARVVNVASLAHRMGRMNFEDLDFEVRGYQPWAAYAQSKLANLLFTLGLQGRLAASGSQMRVVAAHPGWTGTELQRNAPFAAFFGPLLAMSPQAGARPTLRAATAPDAKPAAYYGPNGIREVRGAPVVVGRSRAALDVRSASRLWFESEARTGIRYAFP
ncbi:MAG: oxidoreductase [Pseudomonadota bacterium]|nr:oxidoreductase [Pseudomonadota bacterium]